MSLVSLVDNSRTDKNTSHNYLGIYDALLNQKKNTARNVLEIGVGSGFGSMKLWHDYFQNANVYGIDLVEYPIPDDMNSDRINLFLSFDAYDSNFFTDKILNLDKKFDLIVDDGPHSLESMKRFITLYRHILADDGIMIIEDIQDIGWINEIVSAIPEDLRKYVDVYDLRNIGGRYDDLILVINRSKNIF